MIYYVTFYSYKGGVGRTLALVNTAFNLAALGQKVLIWDLDLEAPSILQLPQFRDVRKRVAGGTIDLLAAPETSTSKQVAKLIVPAGRNLWLLPAGTDDDKYPERYAALPLERLFGPNASQASRRFEQMRQGIEQLAEKTRPDVVLIDSRTGLTDLGAICTVQLPHTVVFVYTMNHQGAAGAQRMIGNIVDASKRLRHPEQQVKTLLVASFVPTDQDAALVEERRGELRKMGLAPHFEIPFRSVLLLREEADANNTEFGRLAERLLELAPNKEEPVKFTLDPSRDWRAERGRTFEDKVALVLGLMDMEVTPNTLTSGRQTDIVAHRKGGLQEEHYVVECKEHAKPTGVDDLDSLHARVTAFRRNEPSAQGLLVAAKGFTAEARAHARDLPILLNTYDDLLDRLINLGPYNGTLIHDVQGHDIERLYVEQDVYPEEKPEPVPLFEYVDRWLADPESNFLTILGDYGTGKTWFTRMLAYRQAQSVREDSGNQRQPVRIDLRSVAKAIDLESILFSHFQTSTGRALNPKAFLHLLEEGRYLLIFDGFDEMATQGDWSVTLENFRQLTRAAVGRAKVLLTCRTHYFRDQSYVQELIEGRRPDISQRGTELYREISGRRGYRLAYLQGFTDDQIHQYIERACGDRSAEVQGTLKHMPQLRDVANRPILLEMIVESAPGLAQVGRDCTIANLYEAYTENWFNREDWRLRITREWRRELVEELAAQLWREPEARLHHKALRRLIEPLLKDRADTALEDADREIRTAAFLTRDAKGNFGFSHRSFLEFFLASWIRRRVAAGEYTVALRHPLLTPQVIQFLEELAPKEQVEAAVRSVLESAYVVDASENALLLYGRLKGGLRRPHLEGARLAKFDLAHINLDRANLSRANLREADLGFAELRDAVLHESNLECARLFEADATNADFTGSNLRGVDFENAHLECAKFASTDLSFANLLGIQRANTEWGDSKQFGATLPTRQRPAGLPVGSLMAFHPNAIATHPSVPLVAVATAGGVAIIDSITGRLRWYLAGAARSVAWASDGRRLALGFDDSTVQIWDVEERRLLHTLRHHYRWVSSVAWDGAGRRLASASYDRLVLIWDAVEGRLLHTLDGEGESVFSLSWDWRGDRLASAHYDGRVRIWDANEGRLLQALEGHSGWVRSVAWDPQGRYLASGSDDQTVRIWDAVHGLQVHVLKSDGGGVWSVAWGIEGLWLASASSDGGLRVWEPERGQLLRKLAGQAGHAGNVWSLARDFEGRLLSASNDQTIRVWSPERGEVLHTFQGHTGSIVSLAWNGDRLASVASGLVWVWDADQGTLIRTLEGSDDWVTSVAWDDQGRRLASGSGEGIVRVWDPKRGQQVRSWEGQSGAIASVVWHGQRLASTSGDGTVQVWEAEKGQLVRTISRQRPAAPVAWHPQSGRLASRRDSRKVQVWDAGKDQLLCMLEAQGLEVVSLAWEATGKRLAFGTRQGTVEVWNVGKAQLVHTLDGHRSAIWSVAWNPDGRRLASASADQTVRVWDADKGQLLLTLEGHRGVIRSVAWDTDGHRLASGSDDNTIKIWDAESGQCLWTIHLLRDDGWLATDPDGKFHGNDAGKRHFMFAEGWSLYPARLYPELDLDTQS